jgi:hypothetical protein
MSQRWILFALHVACCSSVWCILSVLCAPMRVRVQQQKGTHTVLTRYSHGTHTALRTPPSTRHSFGCLLWVLHGTNHRRLTGTHRVLLTGYLRVLAWYYSQGTHRVLPGYSRRPSWAMRGTVRRRSRQCTSIGAFPCGPMHCSIYSCSRLLLQCLRHTDAAQPEPTSAGAPRAGAGQCSAADVMALSNAQGDKTAALSALSQSNPACVSCLTGCSAAADGESCAMACVNGGASGSGSSSGLASPTAPGESACRRRINLPFLHTARPWKMVAGDG